MQNLTKLLRPRTRLLLPLAGVTLLMVATTTWFGLETYRLYARNERAAQRIESLEEQAHRNQAKKPTRNEVEEQKRWLVLQEERAFDWNALFAAVENAASDQIELLEFEPDRGAKQVTFSGEAKDEQALTKFLMALAEQPSLRNVHLTHKVGMTHDRLQTVSFEVKAAIAQGSAVASN